MGIFRVYSPESAEQLATKYKCKVHYTNGDQCKSICRTEPDQLARHCLFAQCTRYISGAFYISMATCVWPSLRHNTMPNVGT